MPIDPKSLSAYAGDEAEEAPVEEEMPEEELDADLPEDRPPAAERLAGSYAVLLNAADDVGDEIANDGSPLDEDMEADMLDALDSLDDEVLLAIADIEPELGVSDFTTMILTMQAQNEEAPDTDAARLVGAFLYHARMALTGDEPVIEAEEDETEEEAEEEPEEEAPVEEEEPAEEEV